MDVLIVLGFSAFAVFVLLGLPWLCDQWREFKRISRVTRNMREVCVKIFESEGTWVWEYKTTRWDNGSPGMYAEGLAGTYEHAAKALRNTMIDHGWELEFPTGVGSDTERIIYM